MFVPQNTYTYLKITFQKFTNAYIVFPLTSASSINQMTTSSSKTQQISHRCTSSSYLTTRISKTWNITNFFWNPLQYVKMVVWCVSKNLFLYPITFYIRTRITQVFVIWKRGFYFLLHFNQSAYMIGFYQAIYPVNIIWWWWHCKRGKRTQKNLFKEINFFI